MGWNKAVIKEGIMNKRLNDRIKNMLTNDRLQVRSGVTELIKSQSYDMLSDFFELEGDKILVKVEPDGDGYIITVKAKAIRTY